MKNKTKAICLALLVCTLFSFGQTQQMWLNPPPTSSVPSDLSVNLLLWWKMNEGTGTTLNDSSGNGRGGQWVPGGDTYVKWTTGGKFSSPVLTFNNVGVNEVTPSSGAQFTVSNTCSFSIWAYASNSPMTGVQGTGYNRIIETQFNGGCLISTDDGSPPSVKFAASYVAAGGWSGPIVIWTTNYTAGIWYNIIFTCNGKTNTLFINGIQVSQANTGTAAANVTTSLTLGGPNAGDGGGGQWTGMLCDCRVWNRVITSQDIAYLQNNP
jgi:large repetitive protein